MLTREPRGGLDQTAVANVDFGVTKASSIFDVWVDDVAFLLPQRTV
jgi:hypothetical protein